MSFDAWGDDDPLDPDEQEPDYCPHCGEPIPEGTMPDVGGWTTCGRAACLEAEVNRQVEHGRRIQIAVPDGDSVLLVDIAGWTSPDDPTPEQREAFADMARAAVKAWGLEGDRGGR